MKILRHIADGLKDLGAATENFVIWQTLPVIPEKCCSNAHDDSRPAVLLIPGYFCRPGSLTKLYFSLINSGCRVFIYNPVSYVSSIQEYAKECHRVMLDYHKQFNLSNLTLIGHSMGGIIAREMMAERWNNKDYSFVRQIISIASPHSGTSMAYMGIGQCAYQMRPNSHYLLDLSKRDHQYTKEKLHCIAASPDLMLFDIQSALLYNSKSKTIIKRTGHMHIIDNFRLHRVLNKLIHE